MLHFIHDDLKCYRSMFCPSVYIPLTLSVTLVTPAKAIGGNKMPFDRDTCMVPSNIVLRPGIYPIEKRQRFRIKTSFQSKLSLQTATKPLPIAKWYYTKSVLKKSCHETFVNICAKYISMFKIFLLSKFRKKLRQNDTIDFTTL